MLAVNTYIGIAHGAVKNEGIAAICCVGYFNDTFISTFANERESAGTSCFPGIFRFSILFDCDVLQVVLTGERAINSPIMRDCYRLPCLVGFKSVPAEFPSVGKFGFCTLGGCGECDGCQYSSHPYLTLLIHIDSC